MQTLGGILGTVGFFLGMFNVIWSMWSYWYQRTERVKVHAEPYVGRSFNSHLFSVYVYNVGRMPVYLKAVDLIHKGEKGQRRYPLYAEEPPQGALQVGEGRRYLLARLSHEEIGDVSGAPDDKLWLSICSPAREVFRVKAKDFRRILKDVVREARSDAIL